MNNTKKFLIIGVITASAMIIVALGVNILFKVHSVYYLEAEYEADALLSYVGTMISAIGTFALGLVAYKQNEKLQQMENNSYVAGNSCMLLINSVDFKDSGTPCNFEIHYEQMIIDNSDIKEEYPTGIECKIEAEKLSNSGVGIPSLIHVKAGSFIVTNESLNKTVIFELKNERAGFSRIAISKEKYLFNITFLFAEKKKQELLDLISRSTSKITLDIEYHVLSDKYVTTYSKCRAECSYLDLNGKKSWRCERPLVFFYKHDLQRRDDYMVLGEEENK